LFPKYDCRVRAPSIGEGVGAQIKLRGEHGQEHARPVKNIN